MFKFLTGVAVGIFACHPEVVTQVILSVKEKQIEAKRDLVYKSKVLDEDLQAFLKNQPPHNK